MGPLIQSSPAILRTTSTKSLSSFPTSPSTSNIDNGIEYESIKRVVVPFSSLKLGKTLGTGSYGVVLR